MDSSLKFWILYLHTTNLPEFFLSELISNFFLPNIPSCELTGKVLPEFFLSDFFVLPDIPFCGLTGKVLGFSQLWSCVQEGRSDSRGGGKK